MTDPALWVPFSLLSVPGYSASSRLVWLLLNLHPADLRKRSGLDPKTIDRARERLAQAPLGPCYTRPRRSCAVIPAALLTDADLSAGARVLYGQLQGVSDFRGQRGSFTYAALSRLTGRGDSALRRAVAELAEHGWITLSQPHRKSPFCFTLRNPVSPQLWARISSIRRRVKGAEHKGEALLREFLSARVAVTDYTDTALPDFLLNPYTSELMELDRYYPASAVAFEFQGAQHFEETDLATFEATVKQVGRDAMKAFLCKARGIELVIIHPEDLSLKAIEEKIPQCLTRRDLDGMAPLIAALEELAAEYRERTAEERARKGPRHSGGHTKPQA